MAFLGLRELILLQMLYNINLMSLGVVVQMYNTVPIPLLDFPSSSLTCLMPKKCNYAVVFQITETIAK